MRERTEAPSLSRWGQEVCMGVACELGEGPGLFTKPQQQGLVSRPEVQRGQRVMVTFPCSALSHLPLHCSPCECGKAGIAPIEQVRRLRLKTEVALPQVTELMSD